MATASTYTLLQRVSLNTTTSSVTFSSIPQTGYTDLKVVISARSTTSNTGYARFALYMAINGSSSTFTGKDLLGFGSNGTGSNGYSTARCGWVNANDATTNAFSSTEIYIPNYTSSNNKSFSVDFATENNNAGEVVEGIAANLWSTTTAISSLTFTIESGYSFAANSTFSLYAVSALGTTPGTPKALGGDIVRTDGTYWYHAFLNTGSFNPNSSLSCDILVIAGGGGGGMWTGGGGGAGGVTTFSSQSLSATNYSVIVGSGGIGGTNGFPGGVKGSNSQFGALTSAVGGGGGAGYNGGFIAAGVGGSGGGGSSSGSPTYYSGAAGTSGQGNAGGNGYGSNPYNGGGGGGYSSAGTNAGSLGGNGGNGLTTYTSWASATSTGVGGYYAGGGGGGSTTTASTATAGGGAGSLYTSGGVNGSPNTGGGGGGRGGSGQYDATYNGGNGGSGIVIVRYAV